MSRARLPSPQSARSPSQQSLVDAAETVYPMAGLGVTFRKGSLIV
jgi:hypothetical protein